MKRYASLRCSLASLLICPFFVFAQKPIVKVDLNIAERREAEVNENGFTPWPVKAGDADELSVKGITFKLSVKSTMNHFSSTYYKTSVQAPYYARLVGDGLLLEGDGSAIELRIQGLPAGEHSLLTYHNNLRGTDNGSGPLNILVDGVREVSGLTPSKRVLENTESQTAYLRLNAQAGKDVVILFENDATAASHGVVLNGFELNTSNIKEIAKLPIPKNADEHADADHGSLLLKWSAAPQAVSHDLYFSADSATTAEATHSSSAFKGNMKTMEFEVKDLYSMSTYYWRVDEVASDEKVTKGSVWIFRPRQLAFEGAEGYGRFARGGRGGKVVEVTNLNDDGPGSLREAVTANIGPRTIVFAVSGIIKLSDRLVVNQRYITIAGQTAPGKGICIAGAPLGVVNDDDIARFLRVRVGSGRTFDGMGLTGADNSIIDHCSISWTIDESFSSRGAKNITLQRTLISEALNQAGHDKKAVGALHGYAATIGGSRGSFHHNLLAHCEGRNWSLGGGLDGNGYYIGEMDITNNVVYNWSGRTTDGGTKEVNFVNNYYKPGPAAKIFVAFNAQHEGVGLGTQRCYFSGNVMPGYFDENNQDAGRKSTYSHGDTSSYETFVKTPFFPSYVTTQKAIDAYKDVLSDVGCTVPVFDDHDNRIISETMNGTYKYKGSKSGKPGLPDSHEDVGGWENYPEVHRDKNFDTDHDGLPDWWENMHGLNPNSTPGNFTETNADNDKDGYTNLDQYLEWMAKPHFTGPAGSPIRIDLKALSKGYTDKCKYTINNVVNGKAKLSNDGTLQFTPLKEGLASVSFTVKDAAGSIFTRQVNVSTASF